MDPRLKKFETDLQKFKAPLREEERMLLQSIADAVAASLNTGVIGEWCGGTCVRIHKVSSDPLRFNLYWLDDLDPDNTVIVEENLALVEVLPRLSRALTIDAISALNMDKLKALPNIEK